MECEEDPNYTLILQQKVNAKGLMAPSGTQLSSGLNRQINKGINGTLSYLLLWLISDHWDVNLWVMKTHIICF